MNRVVRSTRVPIAELFSPTIRSPSQCPGTARSAASAGRSLIMISGVTNFLPRPRVRARGTRSTRPVRRQAVSSRRSAPRGGRDRRAALAADPGQGHESVRARHLRRHEFHGDWNYTIPAAPPREATRPVSGN